MKEEMSTYFSNNTPWGLKNKNLGENSNTIYYTSGLKLSVKPKKSFNLNISFWDPLSTKRRLKERYAVVIRIQSTIYGYMLSVSLFSEPKVAQNLLYRFGSNMQKNFEYS